MSTVFRSRPGLRLFATVAVLTAALAAGCKKKEQAGAGFTMPPTPVETAEVTQGVVADRFDAVGTIEAAEAVTIVSEIDGTVRTMPFREGSAVRKGATLAVLDDRQLRAELARAAAVRDRARTNFARLTRLVEEKISASQDLDDAAAELKVAEANVSLARTRLEKTSIAAPFSGIVSARRVSPGAFVRAGDPITELAQVETVKVAFSAPERYLGALKRGAKVTVGTASFPDKTLTGAIDLVEPSLDQATRSLRIVARVPNADGLFRPGMSADVSAVLGERPSALMVPSEAVFAEGDQFLVYVVTAEGTAKRTPLTLGTRLAAEVEVLSGLAPGMTVVRAGHQKLHDGAKVAPVTPAKP